MSITYRGIYKVKDSDLRLHPGPDVRNASAKKSRYFVVASKQEVCVSADWEYVPGCPTSTDTNPLTQFDVELPKGVCNNPQHCWIRIPALQPVDKAVLLRGDFVGELKGPIRHEFATMIADVMGLF